MTASRLEAFSDGVLAIIITIMVLELKVPHESTLAALKPLLPVFLTYLLSFIYLGIYWNNHHHLLKTAHKVTGGMMWANLHLLFWLSLFPFVTGWMGENHFESVPTTQPFAAKGWALGRDFKGKISPVLYSIAIPLSFFHAWIAGAIYVGVALMWLIPDRRLVRVLEESRPAGH